MEPPTTRATLSASHLFALPAFLAAAHQVISDTVIAAKHGRSHQAEELFGLGAKGTGFVGLMVERKEALHTQVAAAENLLVQVGAKFLKIF